MLQKKWVHKEKSSFGAKEIKKKAKELNVSSFVIDILTSRGYKDKNLDDFLYPNLKNIGRFDQYFGLPQAGEVLIKALQEQANIVIWGDYDVDGITASAVLSEFLYEKTNFRPHVHFSDRFSEGYGLNIAGVEKLAEQGFDLLITVDCGITSIDSVKRAKELGMTVIVTDHHLPKENLPDADAIFNPRVDEKNSYCPNLAGVGVAFFLAAYVNKKGPGVTYNMHSLLDLVALGTIADMVELTSTNRTLAKYGLTEINNGSRLGIAALKKASGMAAKDILTAGQVAFRLAPSINAAGRLESPQHAYELLITRDEKEAESKAKSLFDLNKERQGIEAHIYKEAMQQAELQKDNLGIIVYSEYWHKGVIGIVASNIVEHYNRPVLILTKDNDSVYTGSGRSIPEVHLLQCLDECESLLVSHGGHKQAAGMKVEKDKIGDLKKAFNKAIQNQVGETLPAPKQRIDASIDQTDINSSLVRSLELVEPFGIGNPKPVFGVHNCYIHEARPIGKDKKHMLLKITNQKGSLITCKAWKLYEKFSDLEPGMQISIAGVPEFNTFNGVTSVEMVIQDIQKN